MYRKHLQGKGHLVFIHRVSKERRAPILKKTRFRFEIGLDRHRTTQKESDQAKQREALEFHVGGLALPRANASADLSP